jgi:hypothetical protein
MLPDETEQHCDVATDEQGCSDESEQRKSSRHQPRLVQQGAQQQGHGYRDLDVSIVLEKQLLRAI